MKKTLIETKNVFYYVISLISCVLGGFSCGSLTEIENTVFNPAFFYVLYGICLIVCGLFLVLFINGMDRQLKEI